MRVGAFDITRSDERLTLTTVMGERELFTGCGLIGVAFVCILALGALTLVRDVQLATPSPAVGANGAVSAESNHFGILWLLALAAAMVLVPVYVVALYRANPVFSFDLSSGLFTRNRRMITPLRRIEQVCVRRLSAFTDTDVRPVYRLLIVYGDGSEVALDESHNNEALEVIADEIARFVDRDRVPPV